MKNLIYKVRYQALAMAFESSKLVFHLCSQPQLYTAPECYDPHRLLSVGALYVT